MKYPCSVCEKQVRINAIFCDSCQLWVHEKCAKITELEFKKLSASKDDCNCNKCYSVMFPFHNLNDDDFLWLANNQCIEKSCLNIYKKCKELGNKSFSICDNIISDENLEITNNVTDLRLKSDYLTESEFFFIKYGREISKEKCPSDDIKILHVNCRSLKANYDKICNLLNNLDFHFDVIGMSETWFKETDCTDLYNIEGYNMFVTNRKNKPGGGVLLYVSENLNCKIVDGLSYAIVDSLEVITIETTLKNNKKVIIGCLYRSPNTSLENFNSHFCEYMNLVQNRVLYLCGDFNINLLNYESNIETEHFINNLFSFGMFPLINKPSRITEYSET
jgi:hypothetical protein